MPKRTTAATEKRKSRRTKATLQRRKMRLIGDYSHITREKRGLQPHCLREKKGRKRKVTLLICKRRLQPHCQRENRDRLQPHCRKKKIETTAFPPITKNKPTGKLQQRIRTLQDTLLKRRIRQTTATLRKKKREATVALPEIKRRLQPVYSRGKGDFTATVSKLKGKLVPHCRIEKGD